MLAIAGLFGFLINPPLPLYFMQGLNLTPLHGHTALFGVYGMLGIGLMLSRSALEKFGGQLTLKPSEMGGTLAVILLPLDELLLNG